MATKKKTDSTINIANGKKLMYTCMHHKEKENPTANTILGKNDCKILKQLFCITEGECNWHKPDDKPIIE